MVIKTELCAFSEFRIYPGHGQKFVRRDGQPVMLISSKTKSLLLQRKKPAKLTWTVGWRRLNKKIKVEESARRRTRRAAKFQRAIVGASLDEIKKKRQAKPAASKAQAAALKELKDKKKGKKGAAAAQIGAPKPMASKQKGASNKNARGGAKR
mmetsp:Transcript_13769/g.21749  ORF Transcript_13769/g.21749 Transcript_13769/m.21749 type:complete len:153 (-) Transcript_13769:651-1109(-)